MVTPPELSAASAPPRSGSLALPQHYDAEGVVERPADELFARLDDHAQLASHMRESSWRMLGSRMELAFDEAGGRAVGSHIRLMGRVLGIPLRVEEAVTERSPPERKVWETLGTPQLLVIGSYRMGFEIARVTERRSRLRVFIEYAQPERTPARWLGRLLGRAYARWCVERMLRDATASAAP
jgi:hypothetical protein